MAARESNRLDKRALVRLTSWGVAAAVSLLVAGLSTISTTGSQRMGTAVTSLAGGDEPSQTTVAQLASRSDVDAERRRMNEAIRLLAVDRDRMLTRVGSLERNVDDITGSINRQASPYGPFPQSSSLQPAAPMPATPASPSVTSAAPPASAAPPEWLANAPAPWPSLSSGFEMAPLPQIPTRMAALPPASTAAEAPSATPPANRTEFGVDIGSGSNLDEVRALWATARTEHPRLLSTLRPIVAVREDKTGAADMRLIVGPLPNASAAAKLCASLGAADVMCSTRPFVGQNLSQR